MRFKSMVQKNIFLPKSADETEELVEKLPNSSKFGQHLAKDKNGFKAYTKKHRRPYGEE